MTVMLTCHLSLPPSMTAHRTARSPDKAVYSTILVLNMYRVGMHDHNINEGEKGLENCDFSIPMLITCSFSRLRNTLGKLTKL